MIGMKDYSLHRRSIHRPCATRCRGLTVHALPSYRIASTSSLVQRLSVEQTVIAARLLEVEGIEEIRDGLKNTNINADEIMRVDVQPEPQVIDAKRRALSRYVCP